MKLVQQLLAGDRRAAARLITLIENGDAQAPQAIGELYAHTGRAHIVGITGSPGTGKSTLVAALAKETRRRGHTVGIISIDPTSPFTGGALLGDRIRMQDLSGDRGIFMRSMASRGSLGGLSVATADAIRVLDAFGKETIYVETVGAGQAEVDIVRAAHTTVVVEAPGLGDEIQAFKAGILEIADVFVVNKADREGSDRAVKALTAMLDLGIPMRGRDDGSGQWRPPVLKTVASSEEGIAPLADAIEAHRAYLKDSGQFAAREREQIGIELRASVGRSLLEQHLSQIGDAEVERTIEAIAQRKLDPHAAALRLVHALRTEAIP